MNPIRHWDQLRIEEIKNGGKPTYCIIGKNDYDSLCGAIGTLYGILPFGAEGHFVFHGITVMRSYSTTDRMMFA